MALKVFFLAGMIAATGCAERIYLNEGNQGGQAKVRDGAECSAQFESSRHCVEINWEKAPSEDGFGVFTLKVWRPNDLDKTPVPVELAENPRVRLWMPSMGHGSSPVTVEKVDVGSYRVSQVYFSMGGDWEIRVEIMNGDKVADAAIIPYNF